MNKTPPPPGYRIWDRNNGGYVIYEKNSNTLSVYNPEGLPVSMNRPAPKTDSNPRGFRTDLYPTLEDYLRAQGVER